MENSWEGEESDGMGMIEGKPLHGMKTLSVNYGRYELSERICYEKVSLSQLLSACMFAK